MSSSGPEARRFHHHEKRVHRSSRSAASKGLKHIINNLRGLHTKQTRPPQPQYFVALYLQIHASNHHSTSSFRPSIAAMASLPAAWRAASAHPIDPKSDRFLAGAGKKTQLAAAALWGGRMPSLAFLVANACSLTLSRFYGCILDHHVQVHVLFHEINSKVQ